MYFVSKQSQPNIINNEDLMTVLENDGVRTLRPKTLHPKRTLRPNVNYAQVNYDNVISYAHIPLVP